MGTFIVGVISTVALTGLAILLLDTAHITQHDDRSPPGVHAQNTDEAEGKPIQLGKRP